MLFFLSLWCLKTIASLYDIKNNVSYYFYLYLNWNQYNLVSAIATKRGEDVCCDSLEIFNVLESFVLWINNKQTLKTCNWPCGIWLKSKIYITKKNNKTKQIQTSWRKQYIDGKSGLVFKLMKIHDIRRNTHSCVIFSWRPGDIHVAVWWCVDFGSTRHEAVKQ